MTYDKDYLINVIQDLYCMLVWGKEDTSYKDKHWYKCEHISYRTLFNVIQFYIYLGDAVKYKIDLEKIFEIIDRACLKEQIAGL